MASPPPLSKLTSLEIAVFPDLNLNNVNSSSRGYPKKHVIFWLDPDCRLTNICDDLTSKHLTLPINQSLRDAILTFESYYFEPYNFSDTVLETLRIPLEDLVYSPGHAMSKTFGIWKIRLKLVPRGSFSSSSSSSPPPVLEREVPSAPPYPADGLFSQKGKSVSSSELGEPSESPYPDGDLFSRKGKSVSSSEWTERPESPYLVDNWFSNTWNNSCGYEFCEEQRPPPPRQPFVYRAPKGGPPGTFVPASFAVAAVAAGLVSSTCAWAEGPVAYLFFLSIFYFFLDAIR